MLFFICHIYIFRHYDFTTILIQNYSFSKIVFFYKKMSMGKSFFILQCCCCLLYFTFCLLLKHNCSVVVVLKLDTYQSGLKNYPLLDSISKCNCILLSPFLLAANVVCKPRIFFMPKTICSR